MASQIASVFGIVVTLEHGRVNDSKILRWRSNQNEEVSVARECERQN